MELNQPSHFKKLVAGQIFVSGANIHGQDHRTPGSFGIPQLPIESHHKKASSIPDKQSVAAVPWIILQNNQYQNIKNNLTQKQEITRLSLRGFYLPYSLYQHVNKIESSCKVGILDISENKQRMNYEDIAVFMFKHEVASLQVSDCCLDKVKLQKIRESFSKLKLNAIDVSFNTGIGNGLDDLGAIICQCNVQKLNISDCGLKNGHLKALKEALGEHKMESLDISYNIDICQKGYKILSGMINICNIVQLKLCGCEVTKEKIDAFNESAKPQIHVLDVSYNSCIEDGFASLGETVQICKVEKLEIVETELSNAHLKQFQKNLGEHKLKCVDLSYNSKINKTGFKGLAKMIRESGIDKVSLRGCGINMERIKAFRTALLRKRNEKAKKLVQLQSVDLSYNTEIPKKGFKILASIIGGCEIKKISLSGCDITSEKLTALYERHEKLEKSQRPKIQALNLSANKPLPIPDVVKMSAIFSVEELDISRCSLELKQLKDFSSEIDKTDHVISVLDISEPSWTPNEDYINEIKDLIANKRIKKKLLLCFSKIDRCYQRELLDTRDKTNTDLQIHFDHR